MDFKNKNHKATTKRDIGEKTSTITWEIRNIPKKYRDALDQEVEQLIKERLSELKKLNQ